MVAPGKLKLKGRTLLKGGVSQVGGLFKRLKIPPPKPKPLNGVLGVPILGGGLAPPEPNPRRGFGRNWGA